MKHLKVIAFDCDGVLFDSEGANSAYYNRILEAFGCAPMSPEQAAYAHMHTAHEVIAHLFPDRSMMDRANVFRQTIGYLPFLKHMRMAPDLKPLLKRLRPGFKTAIATNRTDTMPHVLETHGLTDQFDLVVTALDVKHPKPDPEMLTYILRYFAITPKEALYIGDSELDEQAAHAAGIPFTAFRNKTLSADYHITTFTELEALIFQ